MSAQAIATHFKWHNRWAFAKLPEELSSMPDGIIAMLARQYGSKQARCSERFSIMFISDAKDQPRHANAALTHIQRHERNQTGQGLTHARCNERPLIQDDARDSI